MKPNAFDFHGYNIRTFTRPDGIWFMHGDACTVLDLKNSRQVADGLDDDEKITVHSPDGNPRAGIPHGYTLISEAGLYRLIFKSRKPQAKKFFRWITHEVLPSLRQTGTYTVPGAVAADPAQKKLVDLLNTLTEELEATTDCLLRVQAERDALRLEKASLRAAAARQRAGAACAGPFAEREEDDHEEPALIIYRAPAEEPAPAAAPFPAPSPAPSPIALDLLAAAVRALRLPPGAYGRLVVRDVVPLAPRRGPSPLRPRRLRLVRGGRLPAARPPHQPGLPPPPLLPLPPPGGRRLLRSPRPRRRPPQRDHRPPRRRLARRCAVCARIRPCAQLLRGNEACRFYAESSSWRRMKISAAFAIAAALVGSVSHLHAATLLPEAGKEARGAKLAAIVKALQTAGVKELKTPSASVPLVDVTSISAASAGYSTSSGIGKLELSALPENVQRILGYDSAAAEAHEAGKKAAKAEPAPAVPAAVPPIPAPAPGVQPAEMKPAPAAAPPAPAAKQTARPEPQLKTGKIYGIAEVMADLHSLDNCIVKMEVIVNSASKIESVAKGEYRVFVGDPFTNAESDYAFLGFPEEGKRKMETMLKGARGRMSFYVHVIAGDTLPLYAIGRSTQKMNGSAGKLVYNW